MSRIWLFYLCSTSGVRLRIGAFQLRLLLTSKRILASLAHVWREVRRRNNLTLLCFYFPFFSNLLFLHHTHNSSHLILCSLYAFCHSSSAAKHASLCLSLYEFRSSSLSRLPLHQVQVSSVHCTVCFNFIVFIFCQPLLNQSHTFYSMDSKNKAAAVAVAWELPSQEKRCTHFHSFILCIRPSCLQSISSTSTTILLAHR